MSNISLSTKKEQTTGIKLPIFLMTLSMFMTGASGMVAEYVLSTVSSYLNGTSIESFSLTIAIMLGMMGVGGFVQRFVSDKNIIDKFVYLEITLAVVSGFAPIAVYAAFSYTPEHFQLVYYLFAMSIGFMVGFEIPFITRANETYTKKLSDNLSIVFAADYIGAFAGAMLWVYVLLPNMHLIQIGFVLSSINFAVAIITYVYFKHGKLMSSSKAPLTLMVFVAGLLIFGFNRVIDWSVIVEQKMYPDPIVQSTKTPYQQLTLTHNPTLKDTRLYINGSTQFSSLDEARYHDMLIHLPVGILGREPKNVLVLGGGDGLAVRELKKYLSSRIDLVELDEKMFYWSKKEGRMSELNNDAFLGFQELKMSDYQSVRDEMKNFKQSESNRVFFTDANNFINAFVQSGISPFYDMVVIDLPDPYSLGINKMYTKQFYERVKTLLNKDGIVVTQATSPFHAPKAFSIIGKTLLSAGYKAKPYRQNIPSFGEWGWWVASREEPVFKGLLLEPIYLTDDLARSSFFFGRDEVNTVDAEVNSLMRPVLTRVYNGESWKME
jgi:spermidine synthase